MKDVHTQTAIFAAGCFWGCSDTTGHAEAVRVTFDADQVSYENLLEAFWSLHDPTRVNCQGPDVGTQYRSAVFYDGEAQRTAAEASKSRI